MNPLCHDTHQARFALPLVSSSCHSSASPTCVSWTRTVRSCALPQCKSDLCCFEPAITLDDVQRSTNCVNWNLFFSSLLRFEPMSSGTETQHNINCASQTAVMMEGIIRVYMSNCTSAFSSKKKKKKFTSLRPLAPKPSTLPTVPARLRWWWEE